MAKVYRSENGKGAGDGVREARVPVPSSRKFTPTPAKDDGLRRKLRRAIDEMGPKQLKKANSVAEITPTKTKIHKPKRHDIDSSVALHATPRPTSTPPSGRDGDQRRLELLVCRRLLLFVWRRNKTRLAMVSESLRRRQEQVFNLESQVSCLKNLTQTECSKRNRAIADCQRTESALHAVEMENTALLADKVGLQNEVSDLRRVLQRTTIEMENLRNDLNTKNLHLKRLETELNKEKQISSGLNQTNTHLADKIRALDVVIQKQKDAAEGLEKQLGDAKDEKNVQSLSFDNLMEQYNGKVEEMKLAEVKLNQMRLANRETMRSFRELEDRLAVADYDRLKVMSENEVLRAKLDAKERWWRNVKGLAKMSWTVLQHAAYVMLPAL